MDTPRPIGLVLSTDLIDRLDEIARTTHVSRSHAARSCLIEGIAARDRGGAPAAEDLSEKTLRKWRPRKRTEDRQ